MRQSLSPGRRWAAGIGAFALIVGIAGAVGVPSAVAEPSEVSAEPQGLLDESAALVLASSQDREVEVSELTSEWRRVVATPDGILRGDYTVGVARVRDGQGGWRDPDTTLQVGADGVLRPVASRVPISVSAGGTGELASMESGSQQLAMNWRGTLPVPSVDGDTATYADVYPDVDLVVRVGADSLATYLVVKTPAASQHAGVRRVVFDVETSGVPQVQADQAGGYAYKSSAGEPAFGVSVATMWDAAGAEVGAESSELIEPAAEAQVRKMGLSASSSELVVVPDAGFLDDPATVYPVTIDPLVYAHGSTISQRVTQTFTQTNHTGDAARVGYNGWTSPYYQSEMYYRFPVGPLEESAVKSMVFRHDNVHSVQHSPCYNAGYGHSIEVGITGWADASTNWASRPPWLAWPVANGYAVGHENYCNGRATVAWDVTAPFKSIFAGGWYSGNELTLGMRGVGATDKYTWREFFNQFNAGSASRPLLTIEYAPKPAKAQSVGVAPGSVAAQDASTVVTPTLTPTLQAVMPATENCPAGLCQRAVFEVRSLSGTLLWWGLSGLATTGATVQVTVGSGVLSHGVSYKVQVFVENTHYWGDRSDVLVMSKNLQPWTAAPPVPTHTYPLNGLNPSLDSNGRLNVSMASSSPLVVKFCWQESPTSSWVAWNMVPSSQCRSAVGQQAVLPIGPFTFPNGGRSTNVKLAAMHTPGDVFVEAATTGSYSNPVTVFKP